MCLAITIDWACVRCQGTVMKNAYQVPGTACAEAAAKGPGYFGACKQGVERRTRRQACFHDDDDDDVGGPAGHRLLLLRGERLCAGCELDDEVRDLDADSVALDPPAAAATRAAGDAVSTTESGEETDDDFQILPFWVERENRRRPRRPRAARPDLFQAFPSVLILRGGSGYDADDEGETEMDSDGSSGDDDDDDDSE